MYCKLNCVALAITFCTLKKLLFLALIACKLIMKHRCSPNSFSKLRLIYVYSFTVEETDPTETDCAFTLNWIKIHSLHKRVLDHIDQNWDVSTSHRVQRACQRCCKTRFDKCEKCFPIVFLSDPFEGHGSERNKPSSKFNEWRHFKTVEVGIRIWRGHY